jgi:PAS domain S-box-containing protein
MVDSIGRENISRERAGPTSDNDSEGPWAIVELTPAGVVTRWNRVAELVYGHRADEVLGREVDFVWSGQDNGAEAERRLRVVTAGSTEKYDAARIRKDGTEISVSVISGPIIGPSGAVTGVSSLSWQNSPPLSMTQSLEVPTDQVHAKEPGYMHSGRDDVPGTARVTERPHSGGADTGRRDARKAQERADVHKDAQRRSSRQARERVDLEADDHQRQARDAQEQFEVKADIKRGDARDAQEREDVETDADRRQLRGAQERQAVRADAVRGDAREARERVDVENDAERRERRSQQERLELKTDAERRYARHRRERAERGDALERRERTQAQLRQAQHLGSLGQLAGGIAHDFNNVLTVINNYAALVSDELAAPMTADWPSRRESALHDLGQITAAVERASRFTYQLLAFGRREVLRPEVMDLKDVVAGVEEMLRRTLGDHVELVCSPADGLWQILADPGKLEQMLVNLAVNARDAMPEGGLLRVETANVIVDPEDLSMPPAKKVALTVSDTGTGMTTDVVDHVFEPFFTTKPEGEGTGLGLATVYGVVTQAEGSIEIYTEVGLGTTFSILLPVYAGEHPPLALKAS